MEGALWVAASILSDFFSPVHVTKQAEYNRRSLGVGRREFGTLGKWQDRCLETYEIRKGERVVRLSPTAWQPFPGTCGRWLQQKDMSSNCARRLHPSHWLYDATLVKCR